MKFSLFLVALMSTTAVATMTQPVNSWKLFDNPCQMEHGGFSMEICDLLTGFKNSYQKVSWIFLLRNKPIASDNWQRNACQAGITVR